MALMRMQALEIEVTCVIRVLARMQALVIKCDGHICRVSVRILRLVHRELYDDEDIFGGIIVEGWSLEWVFVAGAGTQKGSRRDLNLLVFKSTPPRRLASGGCRPWERVIQRTIIGKPRTQAIA